MYPPENLIKYYRIFVKDSFIKLYESYVIYIYNIVLSFQILKKNIFSG